MVKDRPRNKGFPTPEEYLKLCGADVIFVFFGYNESFAGDGGIDGYAKLQPNGESAPRCVLFSPIAHEDLKDPNLPDGSANNARLAKYTEAIEEVATAKGAYFVDLFSTTQGYRSAPTRTSAALRRACSTSGTTSISPTAAAAWSR